MDFTPLDIPRPFPENVDPRHGSPATWRGTIGGIQDHRARLGFSLNTEQGVVRFVLNPGCARDLAETLSAYLQIYGEKTSHSPISEGSPSAAVSTPDEGLKV